MKYQLDDIIALVRESTGHTREINLQTSLYHDLGVFGDDHDILMEAFSERFNVNLDGYLWYFHTKEEMFLKIGQLFFKPPTSRVRQIDVTMAMLLDAANAGYWSVAYPEHSLPRYRYDILISQIVGLLPLLVLIGVGVEKWLWPR